MLVFHTKKHEAKMQNMYILAVIAAGLLHNICIHFQDPY